METGLQLGSLLLQVGSQMMDLTWSNKDPSNKAVSIFETVIYNNSKRLYGSFFLCLKIYLKSSRGRIILAFMFG